MINNLLKLGMQNHITSKTDIAEILMQRKTWIFAWYVRLE